MPLSATSRLGLTVYSAGADPMLDRATYNADMNAIDSLVAIDKSGNLSARPAPGHAGTYYWATDVPALFRDTGSSWTQIAINGDKLVNSVLFDGASGNHLGGSNPPLGSPSFYLQGGSFTGTTNSGGGLVIPFLNSFPFGVVAVIPAIGDNSIPNLVIEVIHSQVTTAHFGALVTTANTAIGLNTQAVRADWIALGF